jgi:UDP-glucuronate decarboxylase
MGTKDDVAGPINIGNPREFSIKELAELVIEISGSKSKITYVPLPQDDPIRRQPDISLANRLLDDWKPNIKLEQGLLKTIEYFKNTI